MPQLRSVCILSRPQYSQYFPPPEGDAQPLSWPLRPFLAAWAVSALAALLVRVLGSLLLTDPCRGHTALALLMPLLLGPGGLAYTASHWNDRPRAMRGLGVVAASFLPALLVSAYDIGQLRHLGCAGGYLIISEPSGKQLSEMTLQAGQSRDLTGRIGGYQPDTHPGTFQLEGQSQSPDVVVTLPKAAVKAGEVFPIHVEARPGASSNRFDWGVRAAYQPTGSEAQHGQVATSGSVAVTVTPAP